MEECKHLGRNEELQKTEEGTERATDKTKKEYPDSICDTIMEFQRKGQYDLMYIKKKKLGRKENREIQNIGTEDYKGNIIVDKRYVLKIWENYITGYMIDLIDQKT